jgi:hypothetical protein
MSFGRKVTSLLLTTENLPMNKKLSRRTFFTATAAAAAAAPSTLSGASPQGNHTGEHNTRTDKGQIDTLREEPREVPVVGEFDLCVIGGSCTGVFAAVSAARLGVRVAIVENNGFFGGVATIWPTWKRIPYDLTGNTQIVAGLTMEVIDRLKAIGAHGMGSWGGKCHCLNPGELQIELDNLVKEAGVRPFLHARYVAPHISDGHLTAAIIEDKSGRRAIRASYFVDASGDADLIASMGLPLMKHDQPMQPASTIPIVRGLKEAGSNDPGFNFRRIVNEAFKKKDSGIKGGWVNPVLIPGSKDDYWLGGASVMGGLDFTDADALTEAEIEGRRQVRALVDLYRDKVPGVDPLIAIGPMIGVRQTRHAKTLYTLTENELFSGARFHDGIANGWHAIDVHHSTKNGLRIARVSNSEQYKKWEKTAGPKDDYYYQLPYRALVPEGATNVLVAGRCVGAEYGAAAAIRNMPFCNQEGEAAGTASYLALDGGVSVAEVDTDELRATMKKQGSAIT